MAAHIGTRGNFRQRDIIKPHEANVPFLTRLLNCFFFLSSVSGVQCYQCSSFIDPKCGTTWGFRGNEGDQYLHECDENASGCRKLQFEEERSGTCSGPAIGVGDGCEGPVTVVDPEGGQ